MANFYFKGDALFARDVDVRRLARELRKRDQRRSSKPDDGKSTSLHVNQYLDEATAMLSGLTHHAARQQAQDPDITGWDRNSIERLIQQEAISRGRPFPNDLSQRFGPAWQRTAVDLFAEADAARIHGKAEFVAIVGSPGSGKTLLAKHIVHHRGGVVVDAGMTLTDGLHLVRNAGEVLVLDVPAIQPARKSPVDLSHGVATAKTLSEYRKQRRTPYTFGGFVSALESFQSWIIGHDQVTVVPTFGTRAALEDVVKHDHSVFNARGEPRAEENWRRAHVVDLDTLTTYTVDGVGLDIEEGRYRRTLGNL